jgi:Cu+-exporting ATPase
VSIFHFDQPPHAFTGRWLELYGKSRAGDAISALEKLFPSEALLLMPEHAQDKEHIDVEDKEKSEMKHVATALVPRVERVLTDLLEIGDVVRVENGSTPPADGKVRRGESIFDESSLTGESAPVRKHVGDPVSVGTVNKGVSVDVEITALGENTM